MPTDDQAPAPRRISAAAAELINTPKNPTAHLAPPNTAVLPIDHPDVVDGIADLDAMFAPSLTTTEVEFAKAQMAERARAGYKEHTAPRSFLNAHLIIIDTLLMQPDISITRLSTETGYSRSWLHKVMSSDAFQAKLAERQKAIIDPIIANSIKDRIQGLASRSLEIIEERMEADDVSIMTAMEVFGMSAKAMGLGQQKNAPVIAQQFVVHVPPRMASATDWAAQHSGRPVDVISEPIAITPGEENAPE